MKPSVDQAGLAQQADKPFRFRATMTGKTKKVLKLNLTINRFMKNFATEQTDADQKPA